MPRSLILEPTRELAAQVAEHFEILGKNHKLTVALLIGGVSYDEQDRKLDRGADVVIATPGRLLDHFERGKLLLNGIEILVVDEADRMLDMGFIPDIERICKLLPFTRQTLFFSATMPPEIQRLADKFLHSPERIEVAPQATAAATIVQRLKKAPDDPAGKREALRALMREVAVKNAIIFCNRKKDVGIVYRSLLRHGFSVGALHGDLDQHQRTATLDAFRNGTIAFLGRATRGPRPRYPGGEPHLQLRRADPPRRLYPPHRPHRPRRPRGLRRHAGDAEGRQGVQGDREDAPPRNPVDRRRAEPRGTAEGAEARPNGKASIAAAIVPKAASARAAGPAGHQHSHRRSMLSPLRPSRSAAAQRGTSRQRQWRQRQRHRGDARIERASRISPKRITASGKAAPRCMALTRAAARQRQASRGKQQGMGDHVPAFMMRPVRVT